MVRLDSREKLFLVRVVRPCHGFSREVLVAPSLEVSRARLEQPGIVKGVPAHSRGWELNDL